MELAQSRGARARIGPPPVEAVAGAVELLVTEVLPQGSAETTYSAVSCSTKTIVPSCHAVADAVATLVLVLGVVATRAVDAVDRLDLENRQPDPLATDALQDGLGHLVLVERALESEERPARVEVRLALLVVDDGDDRVARPLAGRFLDDLLDLSAGIAAVEGCLDRVRKRVQHALARKTYTPRLLPTCRDRSVRRCRGAGGAAWDGHDARAAGVHRRAVGLQRPEPWAAGHSAPGRTGYLRNPYRIPHYAVHGHVADLDVPVGSWRSVGNSPKAFFRQ